MAIAIICMCLISYLSFVVKTELLKQISLMGTDLLLGVVDGYADACIKDIERYGKVSAYSFVGSDVVINEEKTYTMKFVNDDYFELYQMQCSRGRLFYDYEKARVACIGSELLDVYALGDSILYKDMWYEVVGVLDSVSESFYGNDNACIFVPYTFYGGDHFQILMKTEDEAYSTKYLSYVLDMLDYEYEIVSQSQIKEGMNILLELIEKVLYIVGCVSFVVSMLGIGNVMLLSVEQRHSEIGIRKAIGARDVDIFLQFLMEVCVLSVVGYVIGIICSYLVILLLSMYFDSVFYLSFSLCCLLFLVCLVIGVLAGIVPAYLACKKEVVDVITM